MHCSVVEDGAGEVRSGADRDGAASGPERYRWRRQLARFVTQGHVRADAQLTIVVLAPATNRPVVEQRATVFAAVGDRHRGATERDWWRRKFRRAVALVRVRTDAELPTAVPAPTVHRPVVGHGARVVT